MPLSGKEHRFLRAYARSGDAALAAQEVGYRDKTGARSLKRILAKDEAQALLKACAEDGGGGINR